MTRSRLVAPAIVVALVAVVAVGLLLAGGAPECTERIAGVRPGLCLRDPDTRPAAPDTAFPVLGEEGTELSLADFAGDVVVLNFWASWCGPCRREQPELNRAHDELRSQGVSFLGVNLQEPSATNAQSHEAEFDIPYPSLFDPASAFAARFEGVGPQTLPSTVLIDRQGRVAATILGETTADEVVTITRLLAVEDDPAA